MLHPDRNLLNYTHICEQQQQDEKLLGLQAKYPDNYMNLQLDDDVDNIICHKKDPTQDDWKISLAWINGGWHCQVVSPSDGASWKKD